tara:strand:- start:829 stop:1452 length:624 start_codon:yes stop_codon:yes gene_type:complete
MALIEAEGRTIYNGKYKEKSSAAWADQQGYKVTFTHSTTGHSVSFPGNILDFSDSHASEQKMEYIYGEADPITRTQNTARKISFTLSLANSSLEEAQYNEQSLNMLLCMTYPRRTKGNAIVGIPIVRAKGLNFIKNAQKSAGIGLYISSLVYKPNLEAGFVTSKGTGIFGEDELYPVQINIKIQADAIIDQPKDEIGVIPSTYPGYR